MRRPFHLEHRVADLPAERGQLFLQLRLVVDVRGRGVLDAPAERLDDRLLDRLEAVLEEQRSKRGLEQRGETLRLQEPIELLGVERSLTLLHEPGTSRGSRKRPHQLARDTTCERIFASRPPEGRESARTARVRPRAPGRCPETPAAHADALSGAHEGCVNAFSARLADIVDQPRETAGLGVLAWLLVRRDVFDGLTDRLDLLGVLIRDLDPELILELHDHLDEVERVGAEILLSPLP